MRTKAGNLIRAMMPWLLLYCAFSPNPQTAQAATYWQETFLSPQIQGKGATGGHPPVLNMEGVTKWTLDISHANLSSSTDWFRVEDHRFEGRDLDGPAVWETEAISLAGLSNARFELDVREEGDHESSDYLDVYYRLDGGTFQRVPSWEGLGNVHHTLVGDKPDDDDWGSTTITQPVSGHTLSIRVVFRNNAGAERLQLLSLRVLDDTDVTPIPDLQYPPNQSGASPKVGEQVTTSGVVTGVFPAGYFLQDPGGGPWSGIWIYDQQHTPQRGDTLLVSGTVQEYHNRTELAHITASHTVATGAPLPKPVHLPAADLPQEQWENVLVQTGSVTVKDAHAGYGEWTVDDGSGAIHVDDQGTYAYKPVKGDRLLQVTGPLDYTHGHFVIQPRDEKDILPDAHLVINEIHADPASGPAGDANGDGERHQSQDEFLEIVNHSVWEVDLSGWTLRDTSGLRHTFPAGTTLPPHCAVVIFGGGTPQGHFGNALVQTASSGSLSLNNSGDFLTLHDGSRNRAAVMYSKEGGKNQSLTRHPGITGTVFRKHTEVPAAQGTLFSPGTLADGAAFSGCSGNDFVSIYELQYPPDQNGSSPFLNQTITTAGLVTGSFYSGYFLQAENGGAWSGIWVHDTKHAPYLGDRVRLTGTVEEYFGLTEITHITQFEVLSKDNLLPAPQTLLTGNLAQERWEGVISRIEEVTVTDPDPGHGEWIVDDGSGPIRIGDRGTYTYAPKYGDQLDGVTGPIDFSYNNFKLQPRDEGDIDLPTPVMINEIDVDQDSTDRAEFIELFDTGDGNTDLSGLVLVLYNGADHASYHAYDLDGWRTDSRGYFVICGDRKEVRNCDYEISPSQNALQNGPDAVALYRGDAQDFPNDTPLRTENLLDALVYDTNDEDDPVLLGLINENQPQVNEDQAGNGTGHSNQRFPNGAGGLRNTITYGQDIPTPGSANLRGCGHPATFIHEIQGSGPDSPLQGEKGVTVEGVVVGDFQDPATELGGFFLQEEEQDFDDDPTTSEGIFVFDQGLLDVRVGDVVRVIGDVKEYYGLTELTNVGNVMVCQTGVDLKTIPVTLPLDAQENWESYEGMSILIPQTLTVTGTYALGRDGEVELAEGGRLFTPTQIASPGAPALALQEENQRRTLLLDDGSGQMYPPEIPFLPEQAPLRTGDKLPDITGVLSYGYGRYRLHPTHECQVQHENPRQGSPPATGGTLRVASFNLGNYFSTIDTGAPLCGPDQDQGCRGADSPEEFSRQQNKIIQALLKMEADIVGLMELENNGYSPSSAIQTLVDALNQASPPGQTYAALDPGSANLGTDTIAVGIIYRQETVQPTGPAATLTTPPFATTNRSPLAQTFTDTAAGETFTVVVNHFKSKGGCPATGPNAAQGDGQGCWNQERTLAAEDLSSWLSTDPTGSGDPDMLIIGDLNAYGQEDPIRALENNGYQNLISIFAGDETYSYLRDGQSGQLDYGFTSASLLDSITGAATWSINADEPRVLDYNSYNQSGLYEKNPYRSSDHDPVLIGIDFQGTGESEIEVRGNQQPIPDGDHTPSEENGTDFGLVALENGEQEQTFTIHSTGSAPLRLVGDPRIEITGKHAGDFSVVKVPPQAVSAGGGRVHFRLRFTPQEEGEREAHVVIQNSDRDEPTYTFAIRGQGRKGKEIGWSGGTLQAGRWTITIPPQSFPENSVLSLQPENSQGSLPGLPGTKNLKQIAAFQAYAQDGTVIQAFQAPFTICYRYRPSDIDRAGGNVEQLLLSVFPSAESPGTLLKTSPEPAQTQICGEASGPGIFAVLAQTLPATGFPPQQRTALTASKQDHGSSVSAPLALSIPRLNVKSEITFVPYRDHHWDVRWLGSQIGYLENTAFPTWTGNTVLTGHVTLSDGGPGPFASLSTLRWGDSIIITAWGKRYVYQVQTVKKVESTDFSILEGTGNNTLTLMTCQEYLPTHGIYQKRLVVKAILVEIQTTP